MKTQAMVKVWRGVRMYVGAALLAVCWSNGALATLPHSNSITLKQINSAEKERLRLAQGHKKYDRQPTGFYVAEGGTVVLNVEMVVPAADGAMPVLTVGTMGFNIDGRSTGVDYPLSAGKNTITTTNAGLIYLRFVTDGSRDPQGVANITFAEGESSYIKAPMYVHGKTTQAEFEKMLTDYGASPDVVYVSGYAIATATLPIAKQYKADREKWMNDLLALLDVEDKISGMDDNDPNPIHHRMKPNTVRYMLTNNTSGNPHANSGGYTGYPKGNEKRYLTPFTMPGGGNDSWMCGHEIGHQHQLPAYQFSGTGESTVNIFSYVTERNIVGPSYVRTPAREWSVAQSTYLALPLEQREYGCKDSVMDAITGYASGPNKGVLEKNELRFMVWEQHFLLFGDEFYKRLNRVVREEMVTGGSEQDRRLYLRYKASMIVGYDLRDFYSAWGIRPTEPAYIEKEAQLFAEAMASRIILPAEALKNQGLPANPIDAMVKVTGQSVPSWCPIQMRGITSSQPEYPTIDNTGWTITTSYAGIKDNVNGDDPRNIIDNVLSSRFNFLKPGKEYEGLTMPADTSMFFTIDMQQALDFNFCTYVHRDFDARLKANAITLEVSDDGQTWRTVLTNYALNTAKTEEVVTFYKQTARYLRVRITDWDRANGYTVQVAEFKIGLTANAQTKQYSVAFATYEGDTVNHLEPLLVEPGSTITEPTYPVRAGYSFAGWYADAALQTRFDFAGKITSDTTLYARWRAGATSTGVQAGRMGKLSVYPNPTTGELKIKNEELKIKMGDRVEVYSVQGVLVEQCIIDNAQCTIDISMLPAGTYIIHAGTVVGTVVKR